MERTFTIDHSCINISGGRYRSKDASSAARKAASRLFSKAKSGSKYKNIRKITFCIRETTQGSKKDHYEYKAERVKLEKPVERVINGVTIVNHFKIKIKSGENKKKNLKCEKD
jgi:hypothetical protein